MRYRQRKLFESDHSLIATKKEDQWFDRKSYRIDGTALANVLVGFANADGGTLVIGVENDGTITGVDAFPDHINHLRQVAMKLTSPPVRSIDGLVSCTNAEGMQDHVFVLEIHPSDQLHRTHRNEVYKRIGDETRRLGEDDVRELAFDKGERPFDGMPVSDMSIDELDRQALRSFASHVGVGEDGERALRVRGLSTLRHGEIALTWSAVLLFGRNPQAALPGAHVRILRYDGLHAIPGTRSNLVFDRRIDGTLPQQIAAAREIMSHQVRQVTRLDEQSGRFVTVAEFPEFAWLEAIVNAVTHRSYSRYGDYIRVILFDDRKEVESPGRLPGPVRVDNIRRTRYSRNPRVSRTLADLGIVQELNEGMKRMFEEMSRATLPEPELRQSDTGFSVTLYNKHRVSAADLSRLLDSLPRTIQLIVDRLIERGYVSTGDAAEISGASQPTVRRYLSTLEHAGLIVRVSASPTDPQAFWRTGADLAALWNAREERQWDIAGLSRDTDSLDDARALVSEGFALALYKLFEHGQMTTGEASAVTGLSTATVRRYFGILAREGIVERAERSPQDPTGYWRVRRS